jgi:polysaccharide deacetylase 2 family uncharacterized protein YibQ
MDVQIEAMRCQVSNVFYPHWALRRVALDTSKDTGKSIIVHEPLARMTATAVRNNSLEAFVKLVRLSQTLKDIKE